jgi:hypothetical protein
MSAVWVTLVQWAFVLWGALCCAVFLRATGLGKPLALPLVLLPQLIWTWVVADLARRAAIGRW